MNERELFEQWFCRKFNITILSRPTHMRVNAKGRYSNPGVQVRWETWQDARALQVAA